VWRMCVSKYTAQRRHHFAANRQHSTAIYDVSQVAAIRLLKYFYPLNQGWKYSGCTTLRLAPLLLVSQSIPMDWPVVFLRYFSKCQSSILTLQGLSLQVQPLGDFFTLEDGSDSLPRNVGPKRCVKPRTAQTSSTIYFKVKEILPSAHLVSLCLSRVMWLFTTETESVYCADRNECSNIIQVNFVKFWTPVCTL